MTTIKDTWVIISEATIREPANAQIHVLVADEIKPRKSRSLLLEEVGESLLAALELIEHCRQRVRVCAAQRRPHVQADESHRQANRKN